MDTKIYGRAEMLVCLPLFKQDHGLILDLKWCRLDRVPSTAINMQGCILPSIEAESHILGSLAGDIEHLLEIFRVICDQDR